MNVWAHLLVCHNPGADNRSVLHGLAHRDATGYAYDAATAGNALDDMPAQKNLRARLLNNCQRLGVLPGGK